MGHDNFRFTSASWPDHLCSWRHSESLLANGSWKTCFRVTLLPSVSTTQSTYYLKTRIGGESLAVAQNTYAVSWFKGKELNMVFGLQLSFARLGSTVNFNVMGPLYKYVNQSYSGHMCTGVVLMIGKKNILPGFFSLTSNSFISWYGLCNVTAEWHYIGLLGQKGESNNEENRTSR